MNPQYPTKSLLLILWIVATRGWTYPISPGIWGCWEVSPAVFCAGQKEEQLQLLCVSSAAHGLASWLALGWDCLDWMLDIGHSHDSTRKKQFFGIHPFESPNLRHCHRVFQGSSKSMLRGKSMLALCSVADEQMSDGNENCFPCGFEPATTAPQNNHWRDGDSPSQGQMTPKSTSYQCEF